MTDTNISLNDFESPASLANTLTKICKVSPELVSFFSKTADSVSTSAMSFRIPVNDNQLLSRRIILEVPITFTATTTGANTYNHFWTVPRADLNRLFTNITVRINGGAITCSPSNYVELLQFFDKEDDLFHHDIFNLTPCTPDFRFADSLTAKGGDLLATSGNVLLKSDGLTVEPNYFQNPDTMNDGRYYHFQGVNGMNTHSYTPRGNINFVRTAGTTGLTGNLGAGIVVSKTFTCLFALKNPVLSSNIYSTLCNVNDMQIDLTMSSDILGKCFFSTVPTPTGGGNTSTATISTSTTDLKLRGILFSPSALGLDLIPSIQVLPTHEFLINDYPLGSVANGATSSVIHPTFTLAQVPQRIFLACVLSDTVTNRPYTRSDYYGKISGLQLMINGRSQEYQLYDTRDFYLLSAKNGLKMRYVDFNPDVTLSQSGQNESQGVGMVISFIPSQDLSGSLKEGHIEQFKIDCRYTLTNTTSVTMLFTSRLCVMQSEVLIIQKGQPLKTASGISDEEYQTALANGSVIFPIVGHERDGEIVGGGFFSSVLNGVKSGLKFVKPVSEVVNAVANSGIPIPGLQQLNSGLQTVNKIASPLVRGGMLAGGVSRVSQMRNSGLLR